MLANDSRTKRNATRSSVFRCLPWKRDNFGLFVVNNVRFERERIVQTKGRKMLQTFEQIFVTSGSANDETRGGKIFEQADSERETF